MIKNEILGSEPERNSFWRSSLSITTYKSLQEKWQVCPFPTNVSLILMQPSERF
jgi:hypothetical protein